MPGYWGDEQKTAETIDTAHWLHSGDIAVLDDEGYCQIVGRLKDMLIRGGENIFPREIEEYLFQQSFAARESRTSKFRATSCLSMSFQ